MDNLDINNGTAADDRPENKPAYSMPGILHFIQHEWSGFEMERAQWDVERAELQARIAFLQGERKGQENLKRDLIRRIKMLEYALRQERAKYHKLKFGTDLKVESRSIDSNDESKTNEIQPTNTNMSWKHGRHLLRQYLQEVGYSDTILDIRSQRVRALLGSNHDLNKATGNDKDQVINGEITVGEKQNSTEHLSRSKGEPTENDVFKEFNFLSAEDVEEDENVAQDEVVDSGDQQRKARAEKNEVAEPHELNDTEMALAEFAFLNPEAEEIVDPKATDWSVDENKMNSMKDLFKLQKRQTKRKGMKRPGKKNLQNMLDTLRGNEGAEPEEDMPVSPEDSLPFTVGGTNMGDEAIESALGLGELAGLTVANEADPLAFDITGKKEAFRKTWSPKFTLRSHFDGIRSVRFLPNESALITASEDQTMKLWNLRKPQPSKKTQSLDVEAIYCFRGHLGPVLCLTLDAEGTSCFSGGLDASVRCWKIPSTNIDPHDAYDPSLTCTSLIGHTDAVWSLSYSPTRQQLLSASSDMSVRLWNPTSSDPLVQAIPVQGEFPPTCVEFVQCNSNEAVLSLADGKIDLCDLESGVAAATLADGDGGRVNSIVTHPSMPITISAHDDGHIKFFDNVAGKQIHSMVAHLDSVTCLSVDPNGLYLLSGSHDSSIRLWNLDTKTCIQELTAHRKKFDESIFSVAFHPSEPYIASAGADAMAKVFV